MSADLSRMRSCDGLIAVSAYRSVVYPTAAHTGLRRKELSTLVWADVFLDLPNPHIVVQAKNAKNRKLQPLPLHPEVVAAIKRLEEERRPAPTDRVFRGIFPKRETFRHDLKRAGIQNIEDRSGKLHFHSLRHNMNHRLQENGVVPTVAQHLMRHSSVNLTTKTYISSASLPLAEAIRRMPAIVSGLKPDTPIDTLKPVAHCHSVSQADTGSQNAHDPKILINKGSGHDLTLSGAQSHNAENGRGDRIRTRSPRLIIRGLQRETHKETHIAQRSSIPTCGGSLTHGAICQQTSRRLYSPSLARVDIRLALIQG